MNPQHVGVSPRGGILLGPNVACDGFVETAAVRVQTHIHDDHMGGFSSSKGLQTILMSEATRELLVAELDAELSVRSNLRTLAAGHRFEEGAAKVELIPSEHMLGAVQVLVTMDDGTRAVYSGDFNWPIERIPRADVLVVDSTYGSPACTRAYSRDEVASRFVEIVVEKLANGPVHIKAHRGTLGRALELLDGATTAPIISTLRLHRELEIYRRFGYSIGLVFPRDSEEAKLALAEDRCIQLYGKGDGSVYGLTSGTAIQLSAYMTGPIDPVLEFSSTSYRIAMSGHADFEETLAYIAATEATYVITDNSRGGHAVELATAVKSRLGIDARPSRQRPTRRWGQ